MRRVQLQNAFDSDEDPHFLDQSEGDGSQVNSSNSSTWQPSSSCCYDDNSIREKFTDVSSTSSDFQWTEAACQKVLSNPIDPIGKVLIIVLKT